MPVSELRSEMNTNGRMARSVTRGLQSIESRLSAVESMLTEMQFLTTVLKTANSPRLQRLSSILEAVSSENHSYQIASWVNRYIQTTDSLERLSMLDQVDNFSNNNLIAKKFAVVLQAYAEVAVYYDIANHAYNKGWTTFPTVLEQNAQRGPVLEVENAHSPRVNISSPQSSVPNSIRLSKEAGKNIIITGPNANGKSTFLRTLAQHLVLAEMGSPVPADAMTFTPLELVPYIHPSDSPKDAVSLFMAEGKVLWSKVYGRAARTPFTFVVMDEILPGTIPEIREAAETAFLEELNKAGVLSVTATHSWGTAELSETAPRDFRSFHVDKYRLRPGRVQDIEAMYDGALQALENVGWPEPVLKRIRELGQKKQSK